MPYSFRICNVGIVVKKIISKLGSVFFILLAVANIRVKCPNPIPFVGNIRIVFWPDLPILYLESSLPEMALRLPNISNPIMSINEGKVMIKNGARQGSLMALVMCSPSRSEGDNLSRLISLSKRTIRLRLVSDKSKPFPPPFVAPPV